MIKTRSLQELKKMRKPIINVNRLEKEKIGSIERFAIWLTERVGSVGFFAIILIWTIVWFAWNTIGPAQYRFDPFPAFVLWLFISNMIQIFLMPLIMLGQNLQGRHSEARAENDYEVNLKAEREIEAILQHLENQNEIIESLERKIYEQTELIKASLPKS